MRDQIDGRLWAELGHTFSEQLEQLLKAVLFAFRGLVASAIAAPRHTNI